MRKKMNRENNRGASPDILIAEKCKEKQEGL
jgi:hypothetical protein